MKMIQYNALIAAFFVSVYSPEAAEPILSSAKISEIDSQRVVTHSSDIMNTVWKSHQSEYPVKDASKDHFYIATALIALKRAYLATVFYSPLLTENVWDICKFNEKPRRCFSANQQFILDWQTGFLKNRMSK